MYIFLQRSYIVSPPNIGSSVKQVPSSCSVSSSTDWNSAWHSFFLTCCVLLVFNCSRQWVQCDFCGLSSLKLTFIKDDMLVLRLEVNWLKFNLFARSNHAHFPKKLQKMQQGYRNSQVIFELTPGAHLFKNLNFTCPRWGFNGSELDSWWVSWLPAGPKLKREP